MAVEAGFTSLLLDLSAESIAVLLHSAKLHHRTPEEEAAVILWHILFPDEPVSQLPGKPSSSRTPGATILYVAVPEGLAERIRTVAEAAYRSPGSEAALLLHWALKRCEQDLPRLPRGPAARRGTRSRPVTADSDFSCRTCRERSAAVRGCCHRCYGAWLAKVRAGKTTWAMLERQGKTLAPRPDRQRRRPEGRS